MERPGAVKFKGDELTLVGDNLIEVGKPIEDATLTDGDLEEVKLSDWSGSTLIISTVPSIDTGVCATQTRTFNEKATGLGEDVEVLTISNDLPFAQQRFCGAEGIERVTMLSDYRNQQFALANGLLIRELHLLARSVTVVDDQGVVRYHQLVEETTNEPDYDAALDALKTLV
ncbi:MAG: thiol peroxidase [Planctomycetota bacterium]